jgi:hypothetical protein
MKEHSEFKYLLDLIDMIDWTVVPDFNNKMGRTGYSRRALLKAIFVQKVKGFTVLEKVVKYLGLSGFNFLAYFFIL